MPVELDTRIDASDVLNGLRELERRGEDLRPVLRRLKKPFKKDLREHQRRKEGPSGPWEPRAKQSRRRKGSKAKKAKRSRRVLGKLPGAVVVKHSHRSISGESKVPWAAAHQDGATVGRGVVLPSREFLFFSAPFLEQADSDIGEHLKAGWTE